MKSYGVTMEISPNVPNPHLATKKKWKQNENKKEQPWGNNGPRKKKAVR